MGVCVDVVGGCGTVTVVVVFVGVLPMLPLLMCVVLTITAVVVVDIIGDVAHVDMFSGLGMLVWLGVVVLTCVVLTWLVSSVS